MNSLCWWGPEDKKKKKRRRGSNVDIKVVYIYTQATFVSVHLLDAMADVWRNNILII